MTARWQLPLTDRLYLAAQWAHIDPAPLVGQAGAVQSAIDSGSQRELDQLLRNLCPTDMWDWPAYLAHADDQEEKPTRIRMVAALAHRLLRDDHWANRIPQMLESKDRHPRWQFRDCGDSRDPPACQKLSGRIERFDAEFWQTTSPAVCERVACRCAIRLIL